MTHLVVLLSHGVLILPLLLLPRLFVGTRWVRYLLIGVAKVAQIIGIYCIVMVVTLTLIFAEVGASRGSVREGCRLMLLVLVALRNTYIIIIEHLVCMQSLLLLLLLIIATTATIVAVERLVKLLLLSGGVLLLLMLLARVAGGEVIFLLIFKWSTVSFHEDVFIVPCNSGEGRTHGRAIDHRKV